ncbi:MAG: 4'-phosphopantetheinyl transferase family protein [Pseudomonadota bacterium]
MAGTSSDCNPDSAPTIWLCREPETTGLPSPAWLTDYERRTVAQFSGPRRREYLSSRWLLRQAIASSAACAATDCSPVAGRPTASARPQGWFLSLSHSHRLAACAVSAQPGLGLDIEPLNRRPQWQKVVRRWFTPAEQEWLLARDCQQDFLRVWTLKEAWLKATGRGIAGNLQTLEVCPDFRLLGDRRESGWQAASGTIAGFRVTLVYHHERFVLPQGYLLHEIPVSLDLDKPRPQCDPLTLTWHHAVIPATTHREEA